MIFISYDKGINDKGIYDIGIYDNSNIRYIIYGIKYVKARANRVSHY